MENALNELIQMSKYAGERFDLVQAGGGNTSVKFGTDNMFIKASGYLLSELSEAKGYTTVAVSKVLEIMEDEEILNAENKKLKDKNASEKLNKAIVAGTDRPSIETYLHALLYKYTCHVHAIAVNIFTSHKDWEEKMAEMYPMGLCISYETPGIELALELKLGVEKYSAEQGELPKVIFLQNHGLIVSSDSFEEVEQLTEKIVKTAEQMAGIDHSKYRNTTLLSRIFNAAFNTAQIAYLSEDHTIYDLLNTIDANLLGKPFSPDGYVFCGYTILKIEELNASMLMRYHKKYYEPPKLIQYQGMLYIMASDLKKAKMIEDVFKNNLLIAYTLGSDLTYLQDDEIRYLGNWDAEKYRQEMP